MLLREAQPREGRRGGGGCSDEEQSSLETPVWRLWTPKPHLACLAGPGPRTAITALSVSRAARKLCRDVPAQAPGNAALSAGENFAIYSNI